MIIKSKEFNKFTVVSNAVARDKELSLSAKGLFVLLSSLPPDWVIHKTQLHQFSKGGKHETGRAFDELVNNGYILKVGRLRGSRGQFKNWDYIVYPEKQIELEKPPMSENPTYVNPTLENRALTKKDPTNKEETNKDNLSLSVGSFSLTDNKIVGKEKKVPAAPARAPFLHQQSFQVRQKAFCKEVDKYAERDGIEDIVAAKFKDYFTTPVEDSMLFETMKYWDTQRRLGIWNKNERFTEY